MKRIITLVLTFALLVSIYAVPAYASTPTLSLTSGSVGTSANSYSTATNVATPTVGNSVTVTANTAPTGTVFSHWVASPTGALGSVPLTSHQLIFTMPNVDVALTANYILSSAVGTISGFSASGEFGSDIHIVGQTSTQRCDDLDIRPGQVARIPITPGLFTWSGTPPTTVARNLIPSSGSNAYSVTVSNNSSNIVASAFIVSATPGNASSSNTSASSTNPAYIEVRFSSFFQDFKDRDFENIHINLNRAGSSSPAQKRISLSGTLKNDVVHVYFDGDRANMLDAPIVKANAFVRNVELDLAHNVRITTSLSNGTEAYAAVSEAPDSQLQALIDKYGYTIQQVLLLHQLRLPSDSKVSILSSSTLYVYDGENNFLGTSNEKLPLKSTYIIADTKLTMSTPTNTTTPGMNPDTGAGSLPLTMLMPAILAAFISTSVFMLRKKKEY